MARVINQSLNIKPTQIGKDSLATGDNSTSVGVDSQAVAQFATAFGNNAQALNTDTTALGGETTAPANWNTVVGYDAGSMKNGENIVLIGRKSEGQGDDAVAIGENARANGLNSTVVGKATSALGDNSSAFGQGASVTSSGATVVGQGVTVNAQNATSIGTNVSVTGKGATGVGNGAIASEEKATAVGNGAEANGLNSLAIGTNSTTNQDNTFSFGDRNLNLPINRSLLYPPNAGTQTLADLPVDDTVSAGVRQEYSFDINGESIFTVRAESNGSGGIKNTEGRLEGEFFINGVNILDRVSDTRNEVNQLFIDNARQDFELGLNIIDMDDGQFEIYANDNRIVDSSDVNLNLGSPVSGKGTVSMTSSSTSGFTEHEVEDYGFLPTSVVVTDDVDTNPSNGTIKYEIEDENGNIVTISRSQLNQQVDVSSTIETYAVSTRAVLERNSTTDTSPVLDAYSVYISGRKPDDYLDATVQTVSEV